MKFIPFLLSVLFSMTVITEAQATVCKHDNSERKIEVVYPEGSKTPCEVQYTKSSGMQVLWSAQGKEGYCEDKAAAFVEKQRSWGWQCEASETVAEPQEAAPQESESQEEAAPQKSEPQKPESQEQTDK